MRAKPLVKKESTLDLGVRLSELRDRYKNRQAEGSFRTWLLQNHIHPKTAYNAMAYANFYKALQSAKHQSLFLNLPKKIAFILASRGYPTPTKCYVLEQCAKVEREELHAFIRKKLPIDSDDQRAAKPENNYTHFEAINKHLDHLEKRLRHMDSEELEQFGHLHYRLEQLLYHAP